MATKMEFDKGATVPEFFFFQAEDGIRDLTVTGVQTCALPILSAQYGHWLGDAFASGGSNGYDHKKEGITARGAWECVIHHFRKLGVDVQTQPFTMEIGRASCRERV